MKKVICVLSFLILFCGISVAQEINQTGDNGERVGVWKKYYQNKRIRYEGQFENGKEVGVFKFYSAAQSDFPIVIKDFEKGSDKVKVQFYTDKGIIESEGFMNGKERTGTWIYYHKNGTSKMIEENYKNDKRDGEYKVFYVDGKLTKFAHYKNGIRDGNSKKYTQEGTLFEDVNYINNELNGPALFYEVNGDIKQKGQYEDDLKSGVWEFYTDGVLTTTKEIKDSTIEKE